MLLMHEEVEGALQTLVEPQSGDVGRCFSAQAMQSARGALWHGGLVRGRACPEERGVLELLGDRLDDHLGFGRIAASEKPLLNMIGNLE
jgi:hypothetical protein